MGYIDALAQAPDHRGVAVSAAAIMCGFGNEATVFCRWMKCMPDHGVDELFQLVVDLAKLSERVHREVTAAGFSNAVAWFYDVDLCTGRHLYDSLPKRLTYDDLHKSACLELGSFAADAFADDEHGLAPAVTDIIFNLTGYKP